MTNRESYWNSDPRIMHRVTYMLALLLLFVSCSADAQRFIEVSADIDIFSYPWSGARNSANDYSFSVVYKTGTNEWRIDPSFTETGTSQWWFDGTNVYDNIIAIGGPRAIGAKIRPAEGKDLPNQYASREMTFEGAQLVPHASAPD